MQSSPGPNVLIIKADYYKEIVRHLENGVADTLNAAGATYEIITVPGALEAPGALGLAVDSQTIPKSGSRGKFHGCIVIGCVVRGETSHYDIVCNESIRGLMNLSQQYSIPLGNGIITAENHDQALERAHPEKRNKGRDAAMACLAMIDLKAKFGSE